MAQQGGDPGAQLVPYGYDFGGGAVPASAAVPHVDSPAYVNPHGFPRHVVGRPNDYVPPFERPDANPPLYARAGLYTHLAPFVQDYLLPAYNYVSEFDPGAFVAEQLGLPSWTGRFIDMAAAYGYGQMPPLADTQFYSRFLSPDAGIVQGPPRSATSWHEAYASAYGPSGNAQSCSR